jgi:hypothetical protein
VAVWIDATPTGNPNIFQVRNGGAVCCAIRLTSGGKLAVSNAAGTSVATTSTTIATGQWWRVEWSITHNTSTGSASVDLFSSITATSPTETLTPSGFDSGASADEWLFGLSNFPANVETIWLDIINANDYAKPGAYTAEQTVSPPFLTHAQVFAPTVRPDQFVTPGFVTHAAIFSPQINLSVAIPFITHAQVFAPSVFIGQTVAPGFITHSVIFAPTITISAAQAPGDVVATIVQLGDITPTLATPHQVSAAHAPLAASVVASSSQLGTVESLDMALYAVEATDARVLL